LFAHSLFIGKDRDGVAVAFAHLAPINARHVHQVFGIESVWQLERFTVSAVEIFRDVARDLNVLFLIRSNRHHVRAIEQDVRSHQDRIIEETHVDAIIRVAFRFQVFIHSRLISVGTVHQTFAGQARKHPGTFWDLRHV